MRSKGVAVDVPVPASAGVPAGDQDLNTFSITQNMQTDALRMSQQKTPEEQNAMATAMQKPKRAAK